MEPMTHDPARGALPFAAGAAAVENTLVTGREPVQGFAEFFGF